MIAFMASYWYPTDGYSGDPMNSSPGNFLEETIGKDWFRFGS